MKDITPDVRHTILREAAETCEADAKRTRDYAATADEANRASLIAQAERHEANAARLRKAMRLAVPAGVLQAPIS